MIDAENWREIPNMSALALHKIGADYVQFRPLVTPDADRSWIKDALPLLEERVSSREIVDVNRFKQYLDWTSHGYERCYWAQVQTVITPDGKVYACCNRRGMEDSCLGDLTKERWADVWARSHAWKVDSTCRLMCRGHIPNLTLAACSVRMAIILFWPFRGSAHWLPCPSWGEWTKRVGRIRIFVRRFPVFARLWPLS